VDGEVVHVDDPAGQTRTALKIALDALEQAGVAKDQVVRTRTNTSSSFGTGGSTSTIRSTSGWPYFSQMIAFIEPLLLGVHHADCGLAR